MMHGMELLVLWFVIAVAVLVATFVLPGAQAGFLPALIAACMLGLVNMLLQPVLPFLISPVTFWTAGLFFFFVNVSMLALAHAVIPGFKIRGLGWAMTFSFALTVTHVIAGNFIFTIV